MRSGGTILRDHPQGPSSGSGVDLPQPTGWRVYYNYVGANAGKEAQSLHGGVGGWLLDSELSSEYAHQDSPMYTA